MNMGNSLFFVPKKKKFSLWKENDNDTKVINIMKDKSIEHFYVGRGSIFGNPFSHKESKLAKFKTDNREEAVRGYYHYLIDDKELLSKVKGLHGKTLGCFCHRKMCHADVISLIADSAHIGYPIENNYKFQNLFTINQAQYEIMDERRLALLSEIHESKFILLKKKETISGVQFVNDLKNENEITHNENSLMYTFDDYPKVPEGKIAIQVEFKEAHHLIPIFSIYGENINTIIVAKGQKGTVKDIYR